MLISDLYKSALELLAETNKSASFGDYEERTPYILALFCNEAADLDGKYRAANNLPPTPEYSALMLSFSEAFPLSDAFISSAVFYLASMLVFDENPEMSDKLFDKYTSRMAELYSNLPAGIEKIKNVYI